MTDEHTSISYIANTQSTIDADEKKDMVKMPPIKLGSPVASMKERLARLSNYG